MARRARILVVEGEEGVLSWVTEILAVDGYEVRSARDGDQALTLAKRAIEAAPGQSAKLSVVMAAALAENGRYEDAIQAAAEATKLAQQSAADARFGPLAAEIEAACRQQRPFQSARPL